MSSYPNTPWPSDPNQGQWGGPAQPKPPVIPFHPLNLGNLFDGTFAAIRSNPRVMFAISLGVMGIVGMLSGIVSALIPETSIDQVTFGSDTEFAVGVSEFYPAVSDLGLQGIVGLISAGASLLVTGMLVLSVTNAVVGINLDLKSTWEALKPHFWRLVGTAILVWLIVGVVAAVIFIVPIALIAAVAFASSSGDSLWFLSFLLLLIPLGIAVTVWVSVRLYFATLIAVVEGATPPNRTSPLMDPHQGGVLARPGQDASYEHHRLNRRGTSWRDDLRSNHVCNICAAVGCDRFPLGSGLCTGVGPGHAVLRVVHVANVRG